MLAEVGQLKLVNPQLDQMEKGNDGLFRLKDGTVAAQDIDVRLSSGVLEGSNVNPIEEMVSMIELQRHYELQVKMMKKLTNWICAAICCCGLSD